MPAPDPHHRLAFHGGAGTVTGSRHVLDAEGVRLQIDAGLFQGLKSLRLRNWDPPPYPPESVDALLLTHAHIDHSGWLPRLVRGGFRGPIFCTPATRDLIEIMLHDSAKIQEQDAAYANRKGFSKHRPALPLYTGRDVETTLEQVEVREWNEWIECSGALRARFTNAGHILGSGYVEVRTRVGGAERALVFSGDVGRTDMPLHRDPAPLPPCDVLVVESTYGDRIHASDPLHEQICAPFRRTLERGGVVVVPSFAVGRAQQLTLMLRRLMQAGDLQEVPIHIDSPMAINATRVYSRYLDEQNLDDDLLEDGRTRLFPRQVQFHRSVEESKELNRLPGPRVIVSSSGMLTGGRVLHHLRRRLGGRENLIALTGYQAAGTRGRALLEGRESLRIHGRDVPVRADVLSISGLSAHADQRELLRWIASGPGTPPRVFVVHGEPEAAQTLAWRIERDLDAFSYVPRLGECVEEKLLFG